MGKRHLNHVEDDVRHNENVEWVGRHQVIQLLSSKAIGLVDLVMSDSSFSDHALEGDPVDVLGRVTLSLSFLGFSILKEKHTNEEINQEETTKQNEDNVEVGVRSGILNLRTFIYYCRVHRVDHNIGPSF